MRMNGWAGLANGHRELRLKYDEREYVVGGNGGEAKRRVVRAIIWHLMLGLPSTHGPPSTMATASHNPPSRNHGPLHGTGGWPRKAKCHFTPPQWRCSPLGSRSQVTIPSRIFISRHTLQPPGLQFPQMRKSIGLALHDFSCLV
jgi:hypothetical protein